MRRFLFLLAILLPAATAARAASLVDRIAATVDDVAIPESELRKAMAISALQPAAGEPPDAFRQRVLDALIDQRLQYREALRFGPATPEPAGVDAAVERLKERLRQQGKDPAAEFAAAGMTAEEVRAALERQIVVQNYLQERFRPVAFADEERAREEYETRYASELKAGGKTPEPFEAVAEEMRRRSQQRVFDEETEKWMKEIRQKARVAIYPGAAPIAAVGAPVALPAQGPRQIPAAPASKAPPVVPPHR